MASINQRRLPLNDFRTLFSSGVLGRLSDGQLLDHFLDRRDELAFEVIVCRHGPMVWGVCRRILRDNHDAEDAFQATFLVLARKAASVSPREKLGNWLYGVAYQTAMKARTTTARQRAREKQVPDMPEPEGGREDQRDQWLPLLDQELSRLPEKYRLPVVLCDLEGMTHRQAAERLGWPIGTVSGRLSRARAMLAERLTRRGVSFSGGLIAAILSQNPASASVPLPLIASTTRAATKDAAAGVISTRAAALAEGVLKEMLMSRLKIVSAVLMAVTLGTAGAWPIGPGRRSEASSPARGVEEAGHKAVEARSRSQTARHDGPSADEEMKKLEGTWAVTDAVEEGMRATAEQKAKGLGRVVIKGDKLTIFTVHDAQGATLRIDVNPSLAPKIMGLIPLNDKMEENRLQPIQLGIYELKGDTLTICFGMDRPDGFDWRAPLGRAFARAGLCVTRSTSSPTASRWPRVAPTRR